MRVLWLLPKAAPALLRHIGGVRRIGGVRSRAVAARVRGQHRRLGGRGRVACSSPCSWAARRWWRPPGTRPIGSRRSCGWRAASSRRGHRHDLSVEGHAKRQAPFLASVTSRMAGGSSDTRTHSVGRDGLNVSGAMTQAERRDTRGDLGEARAIARRDPPSARAAAARGRGAGAGRETRAAGFRAAAPCRR